MYPCLMMNQKGKCCSQACDPFGHHAFICPTTTKTSDHNHARDIISSMSQAFGFISHTEVVVAPWTKKPDVEIIDPSGEILNLYLDITLPALHQDASKSRDEIYKVARSAKAKQYPHKDSSGRLTNESVCIPFIITSMGGLCTEGHQFLRVCKKKNIEKTHHMMDVLITQHARWTARRIKRALFGQCLIDFSSDSWSRVSLDNDAQHPPQKRSNNLQQKCTPRLVRQFSSFSVLEVSPPSQSTAPNKEAVVEVDNDLQSSVQLPSEVFQVAFEDLLQTSEHLPATANALETDQFSDISPK